MNDILQGSEDMKLAKEALAEETCTCAAAKDGCVLKSYKRGIKAQLEWLDMNGDFIGAVPAGADANDASESDSGFDFSGSAVADKVVGKAPALIYTKLGIAELFAPVVSDEAMDILIGAGITVEFNKKVQVIMNPDKTDTCPIEKTVNDIEDPDEAIAAVRVFLGDQG